MEQFPTPAIIFQDNPRTDPLLNGKVGVLTEIDPRISQMWMRTDIDKIILKIIRSGSIDWN
jgi:hypothetical protein